MAFSADGARLLPRLEEPLVDEQGFLRMFEFDIASQQYLPREHRYPLEPGATAVGEFLLIDADSGPTIERDDSERKLDGLKRIYRVAFSEGSTDANKSLLVDLLRIPDPGRRRMAKLEA